MRAPPINTIELHPGYVLAAALLLGVQAAMIVALLVANARRRATEARNNAMLRALPDLMFLQTRDGVYLDFSARDPGALIAPPEYFIGKNMRDILPAPLADRFFAALDRLFAGEEPIIVEYEVPVPAGETRTFEARLVRCESDKCLSIVRDITERKLAVAALGKAHAEVLRVSKLATLGEFAGSIVHELAQPLTAIIANARACLMLVDRPSTDRSDIHQAMQDVIDSAKRAHDVVNHTRQLFGSEGIAKAPLSASEIVAEVCVLARASLEGERVAVELRLDPDLPVLHGDRVQLRQVMLNLVSNSVQAMAQLDRSAPRRLTIGAQRASDGMVLVTVSDNGMGLGHVDRDRLFHASYTTKPEGMGWGLSISRLIIEGHGGRLWAEPNADRGATFSFTLPAPLDDGVRANEQVNEREVAELISK